MKTIKISTPWEHNYSTQFPSNTKSYTFEVNNDCNVADFWVVWGGINNDETVYCPHNNIIYITDEAHDQRIYVQEFIDQFPCIASVRKDLNHPNNIYIHEPNLWYFQKSRDELETLKPFQKTKVLSIVASDLTTLPGHKKRYAFVNKMIGHFKDKVDVYGRGFNAIADKWDGIAPYKYSIAIENNVIENYFTEKLTECFLSFTMPIYSGCPNISDYFDINSMCLIDIEDYKKSIHEIEKLIEEDVYEFRLPFIEKSRLLSLNKYHFIYQIIEIIENNFNANGKLKKERVTLVPERSFFALSQKNEIIDRLCSSGIKLPTKILFQSLKHKLLSR